EPEISLAGSAFLPEDYVADPGQKLHLYRRLSKIRVRREVDELRSELADRFGTVPQEVERLLDATLLRLLGKKVGVERILVRGRSARVNFRPGVVPRLQLLEGPLRGGQVEVEVRRVAPLSLSLTQAGATPLARTLIAALDLLVEEGPVRQAAR
ncbi:MAG TPA: TRCF domain-containing protein, partial [Longimicrobiaceae bacterium]|nr:TRCF domain-containing protein [Longimicrobiaceae bacterium]